MYYEPTTEVYLKSSRHDKGCACGQCRVANKSRYEKRALAEARRRREAQYDNLPAPDDKYGEDVDLLGGLKLPKPDGSTGTTLGKKAVLDILGDDHDYLSAADRKRAIGDKARSMKDLQSFLTGGAGYDEADVFGEDPEGIDEPKGYGDRNHHLHEAFAAAVDGQRRRVARVGPRDEAAEDARVVRQQLAFLHQRGYRVAKMNPYQLVDALAAEGYYDDGAEFEALPEAPAQKLAAYLPPFEKHEITRREAEKYLREKGIRTAGLKDDAIWDRFCEAWAVEEMAERGMAAPRGEGGERRRRRT